MELFGEVVFVLLMLLALLVYSPGATLMALCAFAPVIALYLLFVRRPLSRMNKRMNECRREQHRIVNEAFRGYSEVQVNDAFGSIHKRFSDSLEAISGYRVRTSIIQSIPSYMLELAVIVVVAVFLLFNFNAASPSNVLFLGVFSVALLKLMPSVRGVVSAIAALHATQYTKEVIADINAPKVFDMGRENVEPMAFDDENSIKDLLFTFPDEDKPLFDGLNFTVKKGERFGLKGRTGAGKTTLFNILLGLYIPQEGGVYVDGEKIDAENVAKWHKIIGYVPQDVFVADASLVENVALGIPAEKIDRKKAEDALRRASLLEFAQSLPQGMDTHVGEAGCRISGGQRQRLGIARALYKEASVLFFDEATSSLDPCTEREVNEAIEALSKGCKELTIIVISHRDSTLSFCDRIMEI